MKKTISILSMTLLMLSANAQASRFQDRFFPPSGGNAFYDLTYNHDGTSTMVGHTTYGAHGSTDIIYNTINKWGDVTGATSYYTTGADYAYSVDRVGPNVFVVGGATNVSGNYDMLVFLVGSSAFTPKVIGGSGDDICNTIHATNDGGYILAGSTTSFGAGGRDGYLVKLTSTGTIAWTSTYGTSGTDDFRDVLPTSDGGYIAVGMKPSCFASSLEDVMVVKFTSTGTVSWARCIGQPGVHTTSPNEWGNSVLETSDGYVISGTCNYNGGFSYRMFLTKLSLTGSMVFMKRYDNTVGSGSAVDYGDEVIATSDGGFLMCGTRNVLDVGMVKTDASGNLSWAEYYNVDNSTAHTEEALAVEQTEDGYELAGFSSTAAFVLRTDLNGLSGCNEGSYTPTVVSVTPSFSTLGTTNGTGGTISNITLSSSANSSSESAYNCKLCPVDAGPDQINHLNSCCSPTCTSVTIGTPAVLYYTYSWASCSSLSSCTAAQPLASPCATTTYTLTVSRNDCTSNTDAVTVTTTSGTNCCGPKRMANPDPGDSTMEYSLTVFPNPSNGNIHIEFSNCNVSSLVITDITGRKVYEAGTLAEKNMDIDLSAEPKGVYIVTAVVAGETVTQKINIE